MIHVSLFNNGPHPAAPRWLLVLWIFGLMAGGCAKSREEQAPPSPSVSYLEIASPAGPMTVGDRLTLSAVVLDSDRRELHGIPISWSSQNPSVASVDPEGRVAGMAAGSARITASAQGVTAVVDLDVVEAPLAAPITPQEAAPIIAGIRIHPDPVSGSVGDRIRLEARVTDPAGKGLSDIPITWRSSDPSIATIDQAGAVELLRAGRATLSASAGDLTNRAPLRVLPPPIESVIVVPNEASLRVGETRQMDLTVLDRQKMERKKAKVEWKSSHPSIATVDEAGRVTALSTGSTEITASAEGRISPPASITVASKEAPPPVEAPKKGPSDTIFLSGITGQMAGRGEPGAFAGEAERAGLSDHPLALELAELPKDRYGLVDWATAIKSGKVKPRHSLNPDGGPDEPPLDLDVVIFTKSQFQPDVIFPHFVHTLWLTCANCHPGIFPMNAKEANKMMTMPKIAAGEFCGRCHNRVAFPLSDCLRCHVKPKDTPPIDPNYQVQSNGNKP